MGDGLLFTVYDRIVSDKIKDRQAGFDTLTRIINNNGLKIDDKSYHKLLEGLFQAVVIERKSYVRAHGIRDDAISDRLSKAATVLRLLVEDGVQTFRMKTINALLKHVGQTAYIDGMMFKPILLDYIRALRVICSYPPHVEHMQNTEWTELVLFCSNGIEVNIKAAAKIGAETSELVGCLEKLLDSATHHVLLSRERDTTENSHSSLLHTVYSSLLVLLRCQSAETTAHRSAFFCLNKLILFIMSNSLADYATAASDLIPIISHLWSTKTSSLKDQLLISMICFFPAIKMLPKEDDQPLREIMRNVMQHYTEKLARDRLQVNDIRFIAGDECGNSVEWLQTADFQISSEKALGSWLVLMLLARCSEYLELKPSIDNDTDSLTMSTESESAPKRRRLIENDSESSTQYEFSGNTDADRILTMIDSSSADLQVSLLQLLAFILSTRNVVEGPYINCLNKLSGYMSSDDHSVVSWAAISLAALCRQSESRADMYATGWSEIWELCSRRITSNGTCSASCHLLERLISTRTIPSAKILSFMGGIGSSIDTIGPARLTESSLRLFNSMLTCHNWTSTGQFHDDFPSQIARWIVAKFISSDRIPTRGGLQANTGARIVSVANILLSLSHCETLKDNHPTFLSMSRLESASILQFLHQLHADRDVIDLLIFRGNSKLFKIPINIKMQSGKPSFSSVHESMMNTFLAYFGDIDTGLDEQVLDISEFWIVMLSVAILCRFHKSYASRTAALLSRSSSPLLKVLDKLSTQVERKAISSELIDEIVFHVSELFGASDYRSIPLATRSRLDRLFRALESIVVARDYTSEDLRADLDDADFFRAASVHKKQRPLDTDEMPRTSNAAAVNWTSYKLQMLVLMRCRMIYATESQDSSEKILFYIGHLDPSTFYSVLPVLKTIVHERLVRSDSPEAMDTILRLFGERALQKYQYERSELSMICCAELLHSALPLWNPPADSFAKTLDIGKTMYQWLIKVAIDNKLASYLSRCALSRLIGDIVIQTAHQPDVNEVEYLLDWLQDHEIRLQYQICLILASVTRHFAMQLHVSLYNHIHESLALSYVEGQIISCFCTAKLAIASPLLTRDAIYHLVELSDICEIHAYISYCFKMAAEAQHLRNPRQLFEVYASQILYSWRKTGRSHDELNVSLFGYISHKDFLVKNYSFLVAPLFMFSAPDCKSQLSEIASSLHMKQSDIIVRSLDKILAYVSAIEVEMPGLVRQDQAAMQWLEEELGGRRALIEQMEKFLPSATAILLRLVDTGSISIQAFEDAGLPRASRVWKELGFATSTSSSGPYLTSLNQPYFKATVILKAFVLLKARFHLPGSDSAVKEKGLSDAAYIARHILNGLDSCLNSLQQRDTLRVLKLHISVLSGSIPSYLGKISLQTIAPLISVKECFSEVLDIASYIFGRGPSVLNSDSFLRFVVHIMFHIQTIKNADLNFLDEEEYASRLLQFKSKLFAFIDLRSRDCTTVASVSNWLRSLVFFDSRAANGYSDWEPADLRKVLFDDTFRSNMAARRYALKTLSVEIESRSQVADFSKLSDDDCIMMSPELLRVCSELKMPDKFLFWTSRICGRAYACSGVLSKQWLDSIDVFLNVNETELDITDLSLPIHSIINLLISELDSDNPKVVRLMESALRRVLIYFESLSLEAKPIIPQYVYDAIRLHLEDTVWSSGSSERSFYSSDNSFEAWACRISGTVCSVLMRDHKPFYDVVARLIDSADGFAASIFRYLMYAFICSDSRTSDTLAYIFNDCFLSVSEATTQHASLLIRTYIFLQNQPTEHDSDMLDRIQCIKGLNFTAMLDAALVCKMYSSAYLICELMWVSGYDLRTLSKYQAEIYKEIDDPDALYGLDTSPSIQSAIRRSEFERDGWKMLSYQGAMLDNSLYGLSNAPQQSMSGIFDALSNVGLSGLSLSLSSGLTINDADQSDKFYESAWKLSRWDIQPAADSFVSKSSIIHKVLRNASLSLGLDTTGTGSFDDLVREPSINIVRQLTSDQAANTVGFSRDLLHTLAVMYEARELWEVKAPEQLSDLLREHGRRITWTSDVKYQDAEDLLLAREKMCRVLSTQAKPVFESSRDLYSVAEAVSLKRTIELALQHGQLQQAVSSSVRLQNLARSFSPQYKESLLRTASLQMSNVLWEKGDKYIAIQILRSLADDHPSSPQGDIPQLQVGTATVLATLARWVSTARLEHPDDVNSSYLQPAIARVDDLVDGSLRSHVYHEFAIFCDSQLKSSTFSEDFERISVLRSDKISELEQIRALLAKATASEERRSIRINYNQIKKMFESDDAEYQRLLKLRETFSQFSIEFYLKSITASDKYDDDSFRFCSLWLENSDDGPANISAQSHLPAVPSAKLASWINQLSSRLSSEGNSLFQTTLAALIVKLCVHHPYHCLYQIYALKNSADDSAEDQSAISRAKAAEAIWSNLETRKGYFKQYAEPVATFSRKADKLARHVFSDRERKNVTVDMFPESAWWKLALKDLKLPSPTMNIAIRKDHDYSNIPKMVGISSKVYLASGLSRPKACSFTAEDGTVYKMLIKGGKDDLRQDAIMEQVFEQVNSFLQRNENTRRRKLRIRTYKVIPLSHMSGIIEFVQNTIALMDILQPLHSSYYPEDMSLQAGRTVIKDAQTKATDARISVYRKVERKVHPAFRFFFLEQFKEPRVWLQCKTAYTRGTAAISIVGSVLGLGDRHLNNILLDASSGEPVHIDLGVAFDQGRVLSVPETVPFRLTRDIVDGMGVSGIEGVFRRCCEFTLEVLREESENIMTILEVLKYDPLYSWTISPLRKQRLQGQQDTVTSRSSRNRTTRASSAQKSDHTVRDSYGDVSEAERALVVVRRKLSNNLSSDAVVNQWITDACDPRNLALIYCGWVPFY
ncbi:hypothetical protein BZA70DRAFT_188222 [Myxozyma melibiosi]|uniref:Serine/threonine-protein kinase TEL1 n=1 Tax=Myxozyma melibiosi TaxID=54550 RepID=A0ABR1F341_9ASCO